MGGGGGVGRVIKDAVNANVDLYTGGIREISRSIGLTGVTDAMEKVKGFAGGVTDMATGEAKRMKQKAADEANRQDSIARAAGAKRAADAAAAETARLDNERMSAGSGARTLLTGPAGLEDDENGSVSRRTLQGY